MFLLDCFPPVSLDFSKKDKILPESVRQVARGAAHHGQQSTYVRRRESTRRTEMSNRRTFFKHAAASAVSLWCAGKPSVSAAAEMESGVPESAQASLKAVEDGEVIVLENAETRLVISHKGQSQSLVHKPSGQELLAPGLRVPMFTATQYRPYDNELQLAYPAKETNFPAESVRRDRDTLVVRFALIEYEATIGLRLAPSYIGFTLEKLEYMPRTGLRPKRADRIDETLFFQIPLRPRTNLGDWLNVTWDEEVAVNLLATSPYARIDCKESAGAYLFQAGTVDEVATEGVGAALITTATRNLLDRIAAVENDYDLPRGVESRRRLEYGYSYYEMYEPDPAKIERHIAYARTAGFRALQVHYQSFVKTAGHCEWTAAYPNGMPDAKNLVEKISRASIIPGIHFHYNKCHKTDAYVTPKPDARLNTRSNFILAEPVSATATTMTVQENPRLCTMDNERRILKMHNELVSYQSFTTKPPYQFVGCIRGALNTKPQAHEAGTGVGLLDVDTWPIFVRFTQNTDIQDEVAARVAKIYGEAGFKFAYFDGAEDVPPPFWFTVSRGQWVVHEKLDPKPLFSEGACKSHFSWHMLTRGNAFDVFKPEVMKACIRAFPAAEAPRAARDFTRINFGWIGYWAPNEQTMGTQPDMIEYVASRAAAWDCPISLLGDLEQLDAHPRTPDNLEVIKRWEDARLSNWFTSSQREALRNLEQEHLLVVNESGRFELLPCSQIDQVAGSDRPARAFVFQRGGKVWVVYWHTCGSAALHLDISPRRVRLMKMLGQEVPVKQNEAGIRLPLDGRQYLEITGMDVTQVTRAFQNAKIV